MPSILRRSFTLLSVAIFITNISANIFPGRAFAQGSLVNELASQPQPASAPVPAISLGGLGDVLIGENFSFNLTFKNTIRAMALSLISSSRPMAQMGITIAPHRMGWSLSRPP